jgi:hypothetical protein
MGYLNKKEFVSSFMVGINQGIVGIPFDTVKVWMQNNKPIFGRPFIQYYRGCAPELAGAIITNTIVFPIHAYSSPYTDNSFLSGGFAGLCVSPLVYTYRSFKIFQQVGIPFSIRIFSNYRGRGYLATSMREMVGYSMYFGIYSYLKEQNIPTPIAGALAGLCNWGTSFPFDTIMSRQMAQNISISKAIQMGSLYRGYGVCLIRSIFVNSLNFVVYENIKSLFD